MLDPDKGYLLGDSAYEFGGLNTLDPPTMADRSANPVCHNVISVKGLLRRRGGYQDIKTSGSTPNGTPMALVNFQDSTGVEHLVLFTTTKQYEFNSGTGAWVDLTYAATNWTGGENDTVNWTIATGTQGTYLIATNGKDQPRKWNGITAAFELFAPTYTSFVTCKSLAMFYNHLVLINITKGSNQSKLIAWSETNDLVDFNSDLTSGEILVTETHGELEQCIPLGDRLILYATNSIHAMTYVGGLAIYVLENLIEDSRLVSPRAIVNLGPAHILLRKENISVFEGTRLLRDIGDNIHRTYREELNTSIRKRAFGFLDSSRNNVYFGVPLDSSTTKVYVAEYDLTNLGKTKWSEISYAHRPTAMGFFTRDASLTWDAAVLVGVAWDSLGIHWDESTIIKGFPVRVIGTSANGVMVSDDSVSKDNGTLVESLVDTIDFSPTNRDLIYNGASGDYLSVFSRWIEIEFEARGSLVEIWYSTDQGGNYTLLETVTLTGTFDRHRVELDVSGRSLRVRYRNIEIGGSFELRWTRIWFRPGGAR